MSFSTSSGLSNIQSLVMCIQRDVNTMMQIKDKKSTFLSLNSDATTEECIKLIQKTVQDRSKTNLKCK